MKTLYTGLFLVLLQIAAIAQIQKKTKVLFIGNSYTYVNNLPQVLSDLALSLGEKVQYGVSVPGGHTFQNHYYNANTMAMIRDHAWDVVVLQAQSQEPSFSPAQVMTYTYPYAERLVDTIRKYNPCTHIVFYMTWGRQNGDTPNCTSYPPSCTYAGMQARLRESYMLFGNDFRTDVAPVGVAWKKIRTSNPTLNLYDPDESHPSLAGTYLAASVFYSSIFLKSSNTSTYTAGLNAADASAMRATASSTVLDSLDLWNKDSTFMVPRFTYTNLGGNVYSFQNTTLNATSYTWSFGSTQASPTHTFTGNPPYTVKLVTGNSCQKDSVQLTIGTATSIEDVSAQEAIRLYPNPVSDVLSIRSAYELKQLIVINALGEVVEHKTWNTAVLADDLSLQHLRAGMYFISVETTSGTFYQKVLRR